MNEPMAAAAGAGAEQHGPLPTAPPLPPAPPLQSSTRNASSTMSAFEIATEDPGGWTLCVLLTILVFGLTVVPWAIVVRSSTGILVKSEDQNDRYVLLVCLSVMPCAFILVGFGLCLIFQWIRGLML